MSMRIIVTGAVAWSNADAIRAELKQLPRDSTVIFGDCQGADQLAGEIAAELGLIAERWTKNTDDSRRYGKVAWKGLNERMLAGGADLVLGFHPDVANSQGTKHMIDIAAEASVATKVTSQ